MSAWRKALTKEVYARQVIGDLDRDFNPQDEEEESKEQLKMSDKVLIEARGLESDHRAVIQ